MNLTPTSELEAVNRILVNIGETPINTLESPGLVDAVRARQILHNTSRSVQSQGWHWNREEDYPLPRSVPDGNIIVPLNTLALVLTSAGCESVTLRGQRLYDKKNHTYTFERDLKANLVVFLPFDEMPEVARRYVAERASREFQENAVGSDTLASFDRRDEARAWADLQNYEGEEAGYSIFSDPSVMRVLGR